MITMKIMIMIMNINHDPLESLELRFKYSSSMVSLRMKSLWMTTGSAMTRAFLISVSSLFSWCASRIIFIHLCSSLGVLPTTDRSIHSINRLNMTRGSERQSRAHVYMTSASLVSRSFPGQKAVARAENRSSGSTMFSKYLSSLISGGAIVFRLFCVALYICRIISLACQRTTNYKFPRIKIYRAYNILQKNLGLGGFDYNVTSFLIVLEAFAAAQVWLINRISDESSSLALARLLIFSHAISREEEFKTSSNLDWASCKSWKLRTALS